jgi:hypothetical protein
MIENEIVAFGPADRDIALQVRNARDAEIDVMNLQLLGHVRDQNYSHRYAPDARRVP